MKVVAAPRTVTAAEREEHELQGHVVYRSWCRHCVASCGYGAPHRTSDEGVKPDIPEIVMDYYFMGQDEEKVAPHIVIKDRRSGATAATALDAKGPAML